MSIDETKPFMSLQTNYDTVTVWKQGDEIALISNSQNRNNSYFKITNNQQLSLARISNWDNLSTVQIRQINCANLDEFKKGIRAYLDQFDKPQKPPTVASGGGFTPLDGNELV